MQRYGRYIEDDRSGLTINPENGRPVQFQRVLVENGEHVDPTVVAALVDFDLLLVMEQYYEGYALFMVNFKTGQRLPFGGWPIISPDRARFLVHSEAIESNYNSNMFAVYRVGQYYVGLEYYVDGDSETYSWGPFDPKWVDPSTIQFVKKWYSAEGLNERPVTLRLFDSGWENIEQAD